MNKLYCLMCCLGLINAALIGAIPTLLILSSTKTAKQSGLEKYKISVVEGESRVDIPTGCGTLTIIHTRGGGEGKMAECLGPGGCYK